jgi:hypothetical protein
MNYAVQFTPKSSNAKVGAMPVSTTSKNTCPNACPLKAQGCYADGGPLSIVWRALSKAKPGTSYALPRGNAYAHDWQSFTKQIAALPDDTLWRHNQAGDLPGEADQIDLIALAMLVDANKGKRGFTYTHKPMTADNHEAIKSANAAGFTINLSADTLAEADQLSSFDAGPVVVVLPSELERTSDKSGWTETEQDYRARVSDLATPEGRKVAVCPATYRDDTSCKTCGLCQKQSRKVIVGFPAHGASKRKASAVARG